MDVSLSLSSNDLKQAELQNLTRDLCAALNRVDLEAELKETESEPGTKGPALTVGAILLSLFSSGGVAVTLIGVLKSFVDRTPSIELTLEKDGKRILIKTANLQGEALNDTINQVKKLFGAMG